MTRQRANGPGLNRAVARALPVSLEIRALASEENVTVSSGGTTAYYVSPCHRSDPIGCCLDEKWWDKSGGPLAEGVAEGERLGEFFGEFPEGTTNSDRGKKNLRFPLGLIGSAFKVSFLVFASTGNFW